MLAQFLGAVETANVDFEKASPSVTVDETSAFLVLDKVNEKKRGAGAVVCNCPYSDRKSVV